MKAGAHVGYPSIDNDGLVLCAAFNFMLLSVAVVEPYAVVASAFRATGVCPYRLACAAGDPE